MNRPTHTTLFGAPADLAPRTVAAFGVPYDGTTSFRPGTRNGPAAIRSVADGLEWYSPALDRDLDDVALRDLGDLPFAPGSPERVLGMVEAEVERILGAGALPLMLGGEHSLTAGAVRAVARRHPNLLVVQYDANADLRDGYLGEKFNHASAMRRCLDVLVPGSLVQVGVRSGTRDEWREIREEGYLVDPTAEALGEALRRTAPRPIYLTIDLDVFDPSVLPGTGTPEPGGIDWATFAALLPAIPHERIVAADVMELAPGLDPTGVSSVVAAKVVREVVLHVAPDRA